MTAWNILYAVVAVPVMVATAFGVGGDTPARRLVAVSAIGAMAVLYLSTGSRRLLREERGSTAALVVLTVYVLLFAVSVTAVPFTLWLLFALSPLTFQLAEVRAALVANVVINVIPVVAAYIQDSPMLDITVLVALIAGPTGIWLGVFLVRVMRESEKRAVLIDALERSRAKVTRLSHEAGVTAERARLAGEIHDTLAQGFTSIITLLQAADPNLADERIALAVRTARENLAESRALVAALSPSALTAGALPESVRRQATRFTEETGTAASLRVTGAERPVPTAVEVVLLRAAQEALTNVRRHAQAAEASVLLAYTPDGVRLVVRDDGRGFAPGSGEGFGLTGMRARVAQVNGVLRVHSNPNTGTTIELEVPA